MYVCCLLGNDDGEIGKLELQQLRAVKQVGDGALILISG